MNAGGQAALKEHNLAEKVHKEHNLAEKLHKEHNLAEKVHKEHNLAEKVLVYDFMAQHKWYLLLFLGVVLFTMPLEAVVLPHFHTHLFTRLRSSEAAKVLLCILALWVVVVSFTGIKAGIENDVIPEYMTYIRNIIFVHTMERYKKEYQDIRVGEYITRMMDVSRSMADCMAWVMSQAIPVCLLVIAVVAFLFTVDKRCGAVLLTGTGLISMVVYSMAVKCIQISSKRETYYLMMSEKMNDSFGNLMNIYLNNSEAAELQNNTELEEKHTLLYREQQRTGRKIVITICVLVLCLFFTILFLLYGRWEAGTLSSQQFTTVWIVLLYYLGSQLRICNELPLFLLRVGNYESARQFLNDILQKGGTSLQAAEDIDVIRNGSVKFEDVTFKYPGTMQPVLVNFNLEVQNNERVALLGTSGSGKTTAMKLLVGMYSNIDSGLVSGVIEVDGTPISNIDVRHLRAKVNYVNQRTQLFNKSILENIQHGNPRLTEKKVLSTLDTYKLDAVFQKLKHGIHTKAGVNGNNLSLGMQKVIMLMRGLYKPAKIVILDEPLAGLDVATRGKIMKLIMDMSDDKTLMVITHDPEVIPFMDRVVNISKPIVKK
jgi:ABC-type multidrug transport system fused ATPase/permease subunit